MPRDSFREDVQRLGFFPRRRSTPRILSEKTYNASDSFREDVTTPRILSEKTFNASDSFTTPILSVKTFNASGFIPRGRSTSPIHSRKRSTSRDSFFKDVQTPRDSFLTFKRLESQIYRIFLKKNLQNLDRQKYRRTFEQPSSAVKTACIRLRNGLSYLELIERHAIAVVKLKASPTLRGKYLVIAV
ncbi:hypothetical protein CEXT_362391 [Caerostris extrusa]|uniref:Uncharacterized protein n=1 Tax=Caerostris extrusa TaxID=172846 RepID=A0AAV4WV97_CAEEX|nr:hypothetical protein CEXT_362391 [Caerostris extrusa]